MTEQIDGTSCLLQATRLDTSWAAVFKLCVGWFSTCCTILWCSLYVFFHWNSNRCSVWPEEQGLFRKYKDCHGFFDERWGTEVTPLIKTCGVSGSSMTSCRPWWEIKVVIGTLCYHDIIYLFIYLLYWLEFRNNAS